MEIHKPKPWHGARELAKGLRLEIAHNAGRARAVIEQERCLGALEQRVIAVASGLTTAFHPLPTLRSSAIGLSGTQTTL